MSPRRPIIVALVLIGSLTSLDLRAPHAAGTGNVKHHAGAGAPLNLNLTDLTWNPIVPALGAKSSTIAILHTDPTTHATQLLIRVPKHFHVPMHWHSANETHTILEGTFIMECEGKRVTLTKGGFNYTPNHMHHEAWTPENEGALLFITVDKGWDIHWVNGDPKPADMLEWRPERQSQPITKSGPRLSD